MDTFMFQSELY